MKALPALPPASVCLKLRQGHLRLFSSPSGRNQRCQVTPRASGTEEPASSNLGVDFGDLWKTYSGSQLEAKLSELSPDGSKLERPVEAVKESVTDSTEQASSKLATATEGTVGKTSEANHAAADAVNTAGDALHSTAKGTQAAQEGASDQISSPVSVQAEKADSALSSSAQGAADVVPGDAAEKLSESLGKKIDKSGAALSSGSGGAEREAASSLSKAAETPSTSAPDAADSLPQSGGVWDSANESSRGAADTAASPLNRPQEGPLDSVTASLSDFKQGILDKAAGVKASASQAFSDATGDLRDQMESISSGFGKQMDQQVEGVSKQLEDMSGFAGGALQDAADQIDSAKAAASDAVSSFGEQIRDQTSSIVDSLPPPARDAAYAAADVRSPATCSAIIATSQSVVEAAGVSELTPSETVQALADPLVAKTTLGAGVTIPIFIWISNRFGGYSGLLKPERAAVMLEEENCILLDIRSVDQRRAYGTPDLRFEARKKGFALPMLEISRRSSYQVSRAEALELDLATTLVQGLFKVNNGTKVIVLDDSEKRAIKLARAVRSNIGLRAFVLQGGIEAWTAAGLPVREDTEYEVTTLDTINDTLERLREPVRAVSAISVGVLVLAAVYDIHKTLQFIGTLGLVISLGTAPFRYATLEEAYKGFLGPFTFVVGAVGSVLPQSRPGSKSVSDDGVFEYGEDDYEEGEEKSPAASKEAEVGGTSRIYVNGDAPAQSSKPAKPSGPGGSSAKAAAEPAETKF